MVKQRFTAADVKAAVDEIRSVAIGMRLLNVYDLSPRVYLLKFGHGERKVYVLFESGVRLHITNYSREKPKIPSQFTLKLRKHVRSWRLDSISQVSSDRVVDLQFGTGEQSMHFVMEIFGQGNFFLTDASYTIMMLLRSVKSDDVRLGVRDAYPIAAAKEFTPKTREEIVDALVQAKDSDTLRNCLPLGYYGTLAEHMLASCGLNVTEKKTAWGEDIERVASSVLGVCAAVDEVLQSELVGAGLLVQLQAGPKQKPGQKSTAAAAGEGSAAAGPFAADEFWPAALERFLDKSKVAATERTATFSEAADRAFRGTEQDKIDTHNQKKDQVVLSKREKFLRDHQRRIDGLMAEQDRNRELGDLILTHADEVEAAINLVNDVLATGMGWDSLSSLIRVRQSEGTHPVANIIHELKLYKSEISLLLTQSCDDDDELEDADVEPVVVPVDITLTAFANASKYHTAKKTVAKKLEKTIDATDKAAEAAGKKGERIAKKVVEKRDIVQIRAPMWFEKFHWFMTSAGHIVIGARDVKQADLLLKRYASPGDIFVHCDVPKAVPAIVKNPTGDANLPLASVEEAGIMCVARTDAWRKAQVSAWWTLCAHVSKRLPNGDALPDGQFAVRGAKNYMPAMQLQLAVGVLFRTPTRRPPRESGGPQQLVNVAAELAAATAAIDAQAPSSSAGRVRLQPSPEDPLSETCGSSVGAAVRQNSHELEDGHRQSSGDTVSTSEEGKEVSPTAQQRRGEEPPFPTVSAPNAVATVSPLPAGGAPSTAQLKKLKHLRRGQGSAHSASVSESADGSENMTISLASSRTATSAPAASTKGSSPVPSGVTPHQILNGGAGLHSRARTKLDKIRKRYSEQDEEDRLRAMALNGNGVSKVHQALIQAEAIASSGGKGTSVHVGEGGCARADGEASDVDEDDDEEHQRAAASSSGGKQVTFSRRQPSEFDDEAMEREHDAMNKRASSFEDDTLKMQDRIAVEQRTIVPYLDGCPATGEDTVIDDIIFTVAPYASLRHYAFKVRIAPGTEKKGAAATSIMFAFQRELALHMPAAAEASKLLGIDSIVEQLPGLIKVHLAEIGVGAGSALKITTKAALSEGADAPDSASPVEAPARKLTAAEKKELAAKALEEKLRADRRARQEAKARAAMGEITQPQHVDPTC